MQSLAPSSRRGDGHLWMIALGLSFLANAGILAVVGFTALETAILRKNSPPVPPPQAETVATILAEFVQGSASTETIAAPAPVETAQEKRFARTTPDQAEPPEKSTPFIGERNTRATSDRAPVPDAPPLPSQAGIAPRDETDTETTESAYQDGKLGTAPSPAPDSGAPPVPPVPPAPEMTPAPPVPEPPAETATTETPDKPGADTVNSTPPPREKLLDGPNPVDVQVPKETAKNEDIKPTPEKRAAADFPPAPKPAEVAKAVETPKPKPSPDKAFKGFQRKTAVVGSISRTGRSALDVEDSPLGRYQAAVSRAVELEWQRNCVRHRDFITPGFLTVRFFVEKGGKVRSVQFVGEMETGEVQKGFTLNSIRDAEIPAMPQALRKDYDTEPLELIFRFFF